MLQNRDANLDSTNFQITFQNIKIKSFKLFNNSSVKKKTDEVKPLRLH